MLGPTIRKVIASKCCSIPQILLQILTWEGDTYRLIYNLSIFGGVCSLKIRQQVSATESTLFEGLKRFAV